MFLARGEVVRSSLIVTLSKGNAVENSYVKKTMLEPFVIHVRMNNFILFLYKFLLKFYFAFIIFPFFLIRDMSLFLLTAKNIFFKTLIPFFITYVQYNHKEKNSGVL